MNIFDKNYGCFDCDSCDSCNSCKPNCCGGCGPAAYTCDFSISAVPFDPTYWNVTWCGKTHKVKVPQLQETDTTLSLNYSNATLNYQAERHEDVITGKQLGSLINIGDLRDTKVDYDTDALCYELIYHKYGECGDGCRSAESGWSTFSIDNDGALGPQIRYVRGANRYGCPYFLDVPPTPSEYWFQGWRGEGQENGYYQPLPVEELPQDENGDPYVISQLPGNKQPVIGTIPLHCLLQNLMGQGAEVEGRWSTIQMTKGYGSKFDPYEGNFEIFWSDWNDAVENPVDCAGRGSITGKINWDYEPDPKTGTTSYVFKNIYFDKMTWTVVNGVKGPSQPTLTVHQVDIPSGTIGQEIVPPTPFWRSNVEVIINKTFPVEYTADVPAGGEAGPINFVHMHLDWVNDDEGFLGIVFKSGLSNWVDC